MAFQFNPFTGTLDIVGSSGSGTSIGSFIQFVVADWQWDGATYYLIVTHNLNTSNPITMVYEGTNQIIVDEIIITSANQLRVNSDSTFDGTIAVIKP